MTEDIYGDILFIINFSMDFLALFICGKMMHFNMRTWRMICGASIGGIYGVAALFLSLSPVLETAFDIAAAFVMCFTAHYSKNMRKTLCTTAMFYAVSLLLGGAMTAIYSKMGRYSAYIEIGGSVSTVFGEIELWVFAVMAIVSALITYFLQKAMHSRMTGKYCRLRVTFGGRAYEFSGFFDSGNCAQEPISGDPVVFISTFALREAGAEEILRCCLQDIGDDVDERVRFVPINTVSGYSLAAAVRADRFEIKVKGDFEERAVLLSCDAAATDYSGAQALVPLAVL